MTDYTELLAVQSRKLSKALEHLDYSYRKIGSLSSDVEKLDDEGLETWESFAARFSRVSDIFLTKYLRLRVLMNDPDFSGSLRDVVNQAEKLGFVESADQWMGIRELQNISAHDYSEHDLGLFFERLKQDCPQLLSIRKLLSP